MPLNKEELQLHMASWLGNKIQTWTDRRCLRGVVDNILDRDIVVNEFELQLHVASWLVNKI